MIPTFHPPLPQPSQTFPFLLSVTHATPNTFPFAHKFLTNYFQFWWKIMHLKLEPFHWSSLIRQIIIPGFIMYNLLLPQMLFLFLTKYSTLMHCILFKKCRFKKMKMFYQHSPKCGRWRFLVCNLKTRSWTMACFGLTLPDLPPPVTRPTARTELGRGTD